MVDDQTYIKKAALVLAEAAGINYFIKCFSWMTSFSSR